MKDILRNTIHPFPFMHILHTQKWWPSAWACRLWFPEPWREKRGVQGQQLITKKEHFQQTINNYGLFNCWSLNCQTGGNIFGEEKKRPKKETRGRSKAACGALLVRAVCLAVCARSVGIFKNYTEQFFMSCNISLLITSSQILTLAKPQRVFWIKMFLFSCVIAQIMKAPLFKSDDNWHQHYLIWLQCFKAPN